MWLVYCVQHTLEGELFPSQRHCELPPAWRHHTFCGCRDHFSELREKTRKPTQTSSYAMGMGTEVTIFGLIIILGHCCVSHIKKNPTLLAKM